MSWPTFAQVETALHATCKAGWGREMSVPYPLAFSRRLDTLPPELVAARGADRVALVAALKQWGLTRNAGLIADYMLAGGELRNSRLREHYEEITAQRAATAETLAERGRRRADPLAALPVDDEPVTI